MSAYPLIAPSAWAGYAGRPDAYPGWVAPKSKFCQIAWAGHEWDPLFAKRAWSVSQPDADTVRTELREHDQIAFDISQRTGSERCELAASYDGNYGGVVQRPPGPGRVPINTPVRVSYGLTIEPGPTNSASWLVLTQFHEDQVVGSPPISVGLASGSDRMTIGRGYTDAGGHAVNGPVYTDAASLERGRRYQMVQWMVVDPTGNGRLVVYRDGVLLVDFHGAVGYRGQTNSFWKFGPYRHGPTPETIAVRYDHMAFQWGVVP